MDKQDINRAARAIRELMREHDYREVVRMAERLSLNKCNSGLMILDIVEAYEKLGNKIAAKDTLLDYYDVHGITGRNMMRKLIELCVETRDIENAVGLCMAFENEWPDSSISYLMRYQIVASAGGNLEEQIYYLEKYKETEFEERWAYELARLYDRDNQREKCAAVCHQIICYFGQGKYVEKAAKLKERCGGLTEDEIRVLGNALRREQEAQTLAPESLGAVPEVTEEAVTEVVANEPEQIDTDSAEYKIKEARAAKLREMEEAARLRKEEAAAAATASAETEVEDMEAVTEKATVSDADEAQQKIDAARAAKIAEMEEAARRRREEKELTQQRKRQMVEESVYAADRYAQVENKSGKEIVFEGFVKNTGKQETAPKKESGFFGRLSEGFRKSFSPEEKEEDKERIVYSDEVEYITVGRNTKEYVQDIEDRMIAELDMLSDEQVENLSHAQIKEIYELKMLREVKELILKLIESDDILKNENTDRSEDENRAFVMADPYESAVLKAAEKEEEPVVTEKIESEEPEKEDVQAEMDEQIAEEAGPSEEASEVTQPVEADVKMEEPEATKDDVLLESNKDEKTDISEETADQKEEIPAETSVDSVKEPEKPKEDEILDAVFEVTEESVKVEEEPVLKDVSDEEILASEKFRECVLAYAKQENYTVDDNALITILVLAEEMEEKGQVLTKSVAKLMSKEAVAKAEKGGALDKIFGNRNKKRILKDRHFSIVKK